MTIQQVEDKVIELIYRDPFIPFIIEYNDGSIVEVPHPRLAINGGGATFFGPDGGLVDIEFKDVRSIRVGNVEVVL